MLNFFLFKSGVRRCYYVEDNTDTDADTEYDTEADFKIDYDRSLDEMKECQKAYCDAMIQRHNELRALHSADPLTEDPELTKQAQEYSFQLTRSGRNLLIHSPGSGRSHGEESCLA